MNTKNNQRTRLSKLLFKNALMDLLKEKGSVAKISVRELCDRAELNRSTFYAHYNEPKDLLYEIETELLDATEEHLKKIGEENDAGAHKYILSFLQYIKQNDKQFRTLLIDSADPEFRSRFMQQSIIQFVNNLRIELPKDLEQYIFSYILNGSTGIIIQWIRSNYAVNENEIVNLLFSINQNALVNLDLK
ncbi:MAG: TetR-like C-terminal domain-containing protein [Eubacterium sp.]|nr:TetR family transcriptional regulator C-terminal domain-containing protein [Eubacterium sp.]MDY4110953.1 TetR-like C-terminal domain-containing protein [Eubacterium sp.]